MMQEWPDDRASKYKGLRDNQDFSLVVPISRRAYILIYDVGGDKMLIGKRLSSADWLLPGYPCLFGGKYDTKEKNDREAIVRELREETGGHVTLPASAILHPLYDEIDNKSKQHLYFYWANADELVIHINNFAANQEVEELIWSRMHLISETADNRKCWIKLMLANFDSQPVRTPHNDGLFCSSITAKAIHAFVKNIRGRVLEDYHRYLTEKNEARRLLQTL